MQEEIEKTEGEQLDLIDIKPENAKEIIDAARIYKKAQTARLKALGEEVERKAEVLRLVKAADLQPLDGGKIKFKHDGFIISVTPRDELITVQEKEENQ